MERLTKRNKSRAECNVGYCPEDCNFCQMNKDISNKLADYEDAEEQGLLLRLPCKVGEPFYEIINGEIKQVSLCANWRVARYVEGGIFGELAFLTKEEAEQKLAEMKGE